ncbi:uncharacterized protein ACO6RY_02159 [Pungitius sinensis]
MPAVVSPAACRGQHCAARGVRSASTQRRRRRVDGRPSAILHILANLFGLKRKTLPFPIWITHVGESRNKDPFMC